MYMVPRGEMPTYGELFFFLLVEANRQSQWLATILNAAVHDSQMMKPNKFEADIWGFMSNVFTNGQI